MDRHPPTGPLSERQLLDEYFIEHRTQVLDLAAFLDRLDRARDVGLEDDVRRGALRRAVEALGASQPSRVQAIQLLLSDPRTGPRGFPDRKSALGAYDDHPEGGL